MAETKSRLAELANETFYADALAAATTTPTTETAPVIEKPIETPAPKAEEKPETPAPAAAEKDKIIATPAELEYDDAKAVAAFNKKYNTSYKSMDEIHAPKVQTEEDVKKEAERIRGAAIEFGKSNAYGKPFTQSEYDQFVQFSSRDKFSVVRENGIAAVKTANPTMSDDEVENVVDEFYHANAPQDSPLYKMGQDRINERYEGLKKEKYENILGVEGAYKQHREITERAEREGNEYKAELIAALNDLPKTLDFKIGDTTIPFTIDYTNDKVKEAVENIKNTYATYDMMAALRGQNGRTESAILKSQMNNALKLALNEITHESVAKSYAATLLDKNMAGEKGILPALQITSSEPVTTPVISKRLRDIAVSQGILSGS